MKRARRGSIAKARPTLRPAAVTARAMLERVGDGVVVLDRDWRYAYINASGAALFGRTPADLIGRHIWTEFPEGVGQPFQLAYQRAMATQQPIVLEDYYAPWDRWFENRVFPSPDGLTILYHEVTDRRRAQELLRGQSQVLGMIAEGLPLARVLEALVLMIERIIPETMASVVLLDADGRHVRHGASSRLPASFLAAIDGQPIGERAGSCGTAMHRRETVIVEDILVDPLWERYRDLAREHGLRSCWSTPIRDTAGGVVGSFAMYGRQPSRPSAAHQHAIAVATQTAAIAITRAAETERHRALLERLQLVVEGTQTGLWDWDLRSDRVVFSREWKRQLGFDDDEVANSREEWRRLTHPDDADRVLEGVRAYLERPVGTHEDEFRMRHRDGQYRWILARATALVDAGGRPVRMIGVHLDVTERRRAEEAQRESAEFARQIISSAQEGIVVHDAALRYTMWNPFMEALTGLPAGEVLGRHPVDVFPELAEQVVDVLERALAGVMIALPPAPLRRASDVSVWVAAIVGPLRNAAGEITGVQAMVRDVTEARSTEQRLQESLERLRKVATGQERAREAERTRVAREIHDELGQALAGVKMDLAWLRPRVAGQQELVDRLDAMSDLVDQTVQVGRRIASELRPGVLDDLGLASAVRWQAREFARRTGVAVRCEVDETAVVDDERATAAFRILQEALTNVARHAGAKTVTLRLSGQDGVLQLEVLDNGKGITPAQATGAASYGLLGVRERAEAWGGQVRVAAAPGGGTQVLVRIPLPNPGAPSGRSVR